MNQDEQMTDLALRLLGRAYDELDAGEQRVIRSIAERSPTSRDVEDDEVASRPRLGGRLADKVAAIGGSWGFIIGFAVVLFARMTINSRLFDHSGLAFDPYPDRKSTRLNSSH